MGGEKEKPEAATTTVKLPLLPFGSGGVGLLALCHSWLGEHNAGGRICHFKIVCGTGRNRPAESPVSYGGEKIWLSVERNNPARAIYVSEFASLPPHGKTVTAIHACWQFRDVREQITLL
jgi:hypothetical protein